MDPNCGVRIAGTAVDECRRQTSLSVCAGLGSPVEGTQEAICQVCASSCCVNNTSNSTCLPAMSMSPMRLSGASTRTWSTPTARPPRARGRHRCEPKATHWLPRVYRATCLSSLRRAGKSNAEQRHPGLLRPQPYNSNRPTERINGGLRHLRGSALGF